MLIGKKILLVAAGFIGLWLGMKYLLPLVLPFLLGAGLALVSEPLVRRLSASLSRGISAGFGVAVTLVALALVVYFTGAVAVDQLKSMAGAVPDLQNTAVQATQLVQDFFIQLSERAPEGVRPMLQRSVLEFFDDGTVLVNQLAQHAPGFIGSALGRVGEGAVGVGTGVLSAFLISARLPKLQEKIRSSIPQSWYATCHPVWHRLKKGLGGWLKAQLKLMGATWCILTIGFVILRIPYAPMWALVVSIVDAVPILGTGTILLPWALVCFLQKEALRGVGLICIYGVTFLTRTILEPRLVGKQLGLDPLLTLVALYIGYRFWGILGMLFMPILASCAVNLLPKEQNT